MALIKPVGALTAEDLDLFALWEFASDLDADGDSPWVRPVDSETVPVDDRHVYRVACDIELAGGRMLSGHVGVHDGAWDGEPPTAVDDAGEGFVLGRPPHESRVAAFAALFGAPFADVFPVRWRLRLPFAGEPAHREGELARPADAGPRVH